MSAVQEALKKALARFQMIDQGQAVFVRDAIDECKSALSDIEKCEPVYQQYQQYEGWKDCTKEYFDNLPDYVEEVRVLYTSPISIEELTRDRDEWKAATIEANKRFEYAEREVAKLKAELNDTRDAYREVCAQLAEQDN